MSTGMPAAWRSSGFVESQGEYQLRDELRAGVQFRREDIRESMPEGSFDLILCRNLAFTYFDTALQRSVLKGLLERLTPQGLLLIGIHEALPEEAGVVASDRTPGLYRASCRRSD